MRNLLAEFPGSLRAHKGAYVNHVADDDANAANDCIQKDLMAVFTLEDEQIVWHLSVWCEFMSHCRRLIRLDGQIVLKKSSVPFAHQTTCPSRRFVRPIVWKRPMRGTIAMHVRFKSWLILLFANKIAKWPIQFWVSGKLELRHDGEMLMFLFHELSALCTCWARDNSDTLGHTE